MVFLVLSLCSVLVGKPTEVSEDGAVSILSPEDGGSMFLRNVGKLPGDYTAQHRRP
jgi:hypothetical protein